MELLWGLLLLPCSLHVTFLEQPRTLFFPCIRPNNKERSLIFFMPSLQAPQRLIPQVFQPIILIPLIIRLPLNTAVHSGGVVFLSHNSDEGFCSTPCFSTPRYHVCVSVCACLSSYSLITFHGFPSPFSYSAAVSASVSPLIQHNKQFFATTMQIYNMPFPTTFPALLSLCSKFEISMLPELIFLCVSPGIIFSSQSSFSYLSVFFQSNTSFRYLH
ncbi:hypothetical protein, conserved [Trypanosoma brucei brucei TREU927]|uniref:T. brucei spp.-specific protein n=1 Tax=Trypanosoma brucei brucei (strain 927/4 GUTat10.1) TaxID=185431 RepID=Q38CU0_TRYB2|nr:hypothetical protein, conserved [Trypanosoma brucei brucei TREU927]EAN77380.1 hypothetical protein, conserved [Trypanosoma brucei brucei TREU927]